MIDHVRGEKVVFGRQDITPLEALPSHDDTIANVLAAPVAVSWTGRFLKLLLILVLLAVATIGSLFLALENGILDSTLTRQAEAALSRALGRDFDPRVGAVRLRFSKSWMLAIEAQAVEVAHRPSRIVALKADSIRAVLDPLALMRGRVEVEKAELGTAAANLNFLPPGLAIDWASMRIDGLPAWLDLLFPIVDGAVTHLASAGTTSATATSISVLLPGQQEKAVEVDDFEFERTANGLALGGQVTFDDLRPSVAVTVPVKDGKIEGLDLSVTGLATGKHLIRYSKRTGEPREGLEAPLDLVFSAKPNTSASLRISAGAGRMIADGIWQPLNAATLLMSYDFTARKIEVSEGLIDMGATRIPFNGAVKDVDTVKPDLSHGYAFEIVANDAVASPEGTGEQPERFNVGASGYFLMGEKRLHLDQLGVATSSGSMAGALDVRFVEPSPAVNFAARADRLSTTSIKQIWPYWFGAKARDWVLHHISGGVVTNAAIDVSLAAGRIPPHPEPLIFRDGELAISFDAAGLNVDYLGDLPDASGVTGRFELKDETVAINFSNGDIALPSGKVIKAEAGSFVMDNITAKPLMATLSLNASADVSSLVEYAGFKPIDATARLPFTASDLSGTAKAKVEARFGLVARHKPPAPDWSVDLDLSNVAVKVPIQGRKLTDISGELKIDRKSAVLDAKAEIDGLPFDVQLEEPLAKKDAANRSWSAKGKLSQAVIGKFAPSLSGVLTGPVDVAIENGKKGELRAVVSLTNASLKIPVVDWHKGPGIRATAKFDLVQDAGRSQISHFVLDGDGFGISGDLVVDKTGIVSGKFSKVKLSPADNFSLSLQRKSGGLAVSVSGASLDAKPFIDSAKAPKKSDTEGRKTDVTLSAKVDRVVGYNKESLGNVDLKLQTAKGRMASVSLTAVTASGQALVISKEKTNGPMKITSGDAGAVARFADFYRNMNGGLLNITLRSKDAESMRGPIDIRNFALINEARLKAIVQARAGKDGRSLTDAVQSEIDTSSQKFRRGFAMLRIDGQTIRVENGLARGDEVGATFQGMVRDANGQMDMTGTFMPAYGLNRLFGELPLIGNLLGNGRDRGLLGITFKLEGAFENPKLTVNPLSIIAPGVFRNIFEFE